MGLAAVQALLATVATVLPFSLMLRLVGGGAASEGSDDDD